MMRSPVPTPTPPRPAIVRRVECRAPYNAYYSGSDEWTIATTEHQSAGAHHGFGHTLLRQLVAPLSYGEQGAFPPPQETAPATPRAEIYAAVRPPEADDHLYGHEFNETENRCAQCRDINIRDLFGLNRRRYHMGYLVDILSCDRCPLCRLITHSVVVQLGAFILRPEILSDIPSCFAQLTSVPVIYPSAARKDRVYELKATIIATQPSSAFIGLTTIRLLNEDALVLRKEPGFHGRRLETQPSLAVARNWLQHCYENHPCSPNPNTNAQQGYTIILIDVEHLCLTKQPLSSRYVALSYVWPKIESLRLCAENMELLQKPGALASTQPPLPNVIHEAMQTVAELGEQLLWVDALCIVQDDSTMMADMIGRMDQIYGSAILTLVAATRDGSYLFPPPDVSRRGQEWEEIDGLHLASALPDITTALSKSKWATRAWTLQEAILSRRCLVFTDYQLYFRCLTDYCSEDVLEAPGRSVTMHPARPPMPVRALDFLFSPATLERLSQHRTFPEYASLIREYSTRELSFQTDIMPAFKGIATALGPYYSGSGFFCGLPQSIFDLALLWYHTTSSVRRELEEEDVMSVRWPTWSWPGWKNSVDYEETHTLSCDFDQLRTMIFWYRLGDEDDTLIPVLSDFCRRDYGAGEPDASRSILCSHLPLLRADPTRIVCWASVLQVSIGHVEVVTDSWLSDSQLTIPSFSLLDNNMRSEPCGFVSVADREWAAELMASSGGRPTKREAILLSMSPQTEIFYQPSFCIHFSEKYRTEPPGTGKLINLMIIEWGEDGVAYRVGLGKIHQDAIYDDDGHPVRGEVEKRVVVLG